VAKTPGTIKARGGSPFFQYRLRLGGREFFISTKTASRREAERNKQRYYEDALSQAAAADKAAALNSAITTFGAACELYWDRVGQHHDKGGQGASNSAWSLDWLKRQLGADRRFADIDDAMVSALVARRRGEKRVRGAQTTEERVSPSTVNRSVTQPLRKVLLFAKDIGKAPVQPIVWKRHLLKEPKERVRELRDEEQVALFDEGLRDDYKPMVEIALLLGPRRGELINLKWAHVDFGARLIRILGKGDTDETVPMLPAARDILWALRGEPDRHPEFVFTFVAQRTREYGGRRFVKGERYPYSAEGWKTAFRRAVEEAGIKDFRMHDARHTAASRLHREIGLVGVQEVLRHKQIATTRKYTHVNHEEKLDALQRAADKAAERQAEIRRGAEETFRETVAGEPAKKPGLSNG
jgi:integrase